jgi:tRNA(fMet)-specific endonuclease VapC
MTLKYLLDTNILSEAKRPHPNQKVMTKLRLSKREIAKATLVIHELLFGCFRLPLSKKRQDLEDYVNNVILVGTIKGQGCLKSVRVLLLSMVK